MERLGQSGDKVVSFQESCREAKRLLDTYGEQIVLANDSPTDEGISSFESDRVIEHFLHKFPKEVLEQFVGHGVSKGSDVEVVGAFLNILANRRIKGFTGRLVSGENTFIPAYTRSPFLILSHYKKQLAVVGPDKRGVADAAGLHVDVGAFVVNNDYYPLVEEIRQMYPNANIIRANELPQYIQSEAERG